MAGVWDVLLEFDARTCRARYDQLPLEGGRIIGCPGRATLSRRPLRGSLRGWRSEWAR